MRCTDLAYCDLGIACPSTVALNNIKRMMRYRLSRHTATEESLMGFSSQVQVLHIRTFYSKGE
jgi:hypothetical protein